MNNLLTVNERISKRGFTLIELLIVIGILAILATTVVLVLNPAQILQETRDTQRISDLGAVNSAIGLYLATAGSIDMSVVGVCATNWWSSTSATLAANQPFATPAVAANSQTLANPRAVNGNGWIPINLGLISGGSPLSALPTDPSPNTGSLTSVGRFYAYQCTDAPNATYEINASMESTKFSSGGTSDIETPDGGNVTTIYEIGTAPGLTL